MSDLENHKFKDDTLMFDGCLDDTVFFDSENTYFLFNRDDIIAMAKHFKLTAEDLKDA